MTSPTPSPISDQAAGEPVAWMVTNTIYGSVSLHLDKREARAYDGLRQYTVEPLGVLSSAPTTGIPEQSDECVSCGNKIGTVTDHEQWCSREDHALQRAIEEKNSFRRVSESLQQRLNEAEELNRKFMHETNGPIFMGEPVNHAAPTTGSAPVASTSATAWGDDRIRQLALEAGHNMGDVWLPFLRAYANAVLAAPPASPAASALTDRQIIDAFEPYREFPVNWITRFGRDLIALLAASMGGDKS